MRIQSDRPGRVGPVRLSIGVLSAMMPLLTALPASSVPCGEWDLIPTPNVGNSVTRVTAITALSANDAWSVGLWRDEPVGFGPFAMRWDGSTWNLTSLPNTSHLGGLPEIDGVEATPDGDVWLVGKVFTGYPTDNTPLVLRWREGSWDIVDTMTLRPQTVYPFAARGGLAYEVDALASDDIWVVGQASGFGVGATTVPLAAHWDGSGWTDVDVPSLANRHHSLDDIVAISPDDVWAVGDYRNEPGAFKGVTYHWDGNSWSHVDSPIEHMAGDSGLDDVAATGPNDVWAIGGAFQVGVVLMHWDGSEWSLAEPPPNSGGSLAAVGPNDLWASGWNGFWHWDGTMWTEVPTSVPGSTYVIRSGGMEIVGDCDIWCAGFWTLADGTTSFTLAERLQSEPAAVEAEPAEGLALAVRNPYRRGDPIQFAIPSQTSARLTVHDLQGAVVRRLFESGDAKGMRSAFWDGRTDTGRPISTGIYFLKLDIGGITATRKLLFLGSGR